MKPTEITLLITQLKTNEENTLFKMLILRVDKLIPTFKTFFGTILELRVKIHLNK